MASLSRDLRRELERTVIKARNAGEDGSRKALQSLAVHHHEPWSSMKVEQRGLRNRLRAHGRQLGDRRDERRGTQTIEHLAGECAYEHWHRMLFARFLAENNLLIEPESKVPISLDDCREIAMERRTDWLALASDFAVRMLPQIFRRGDPVLEVSLPPETRDELERLLKGLPSEVFAADDSLGWVYQFWQSERKDEINRSGERIGVDELPSVTQLFTQDYMVLFLLHNTLGAWWTAKRKAEGKDGSLGGYEWTYLRLNEDGTPAAGSFPAWPRSAKNIKVLDPSMGSGHFLVFALPIIVQFRVEEEGLTRNEAIQAVLRDNLFGLEIDPRCTQIAAFNLAWTAWRMVGYQTLPRLNVACSGLGINAKEEEWVKLAGKDERIRNTLQDLFQMFGQAPILGSLIDPRRFGGSIFSAQFEEVRPLLQQALEIEEQDETSSELAVSAQGLVEAARLLEDKFTLVATNVPYLGRGKQEDVLRDYCSRYSPDGYADLATVFMDRCTNFCCPGGTHATVTPQNWLFISSYTKFRKRLLASVTINHVAQVGSGATATASWDVVRALTVLSVEKPRIEYPVTGVASDAADEEQRSIDIRTKPLLIASVSALKDGPDSRIALALADQNRRRLLEGRKPLPLLREYADSYWGLGSGDGERFCYQFWEIPRQTTDWEFLQVTFSPGAPAIGKQQVVFWQQGRGALYQLAEESKEKLKNIWQRGHEAWGKLGVAISQMGGLPATLYFGEIFQNGVAAIVPKQEEHLAAIWAFCSSPEFVEQVRKLDQKLAVTNATLVKVPFDVDYWLKVVQQQYPNGLPSPKSESLDEWLFDGHPLHSRSPLHVAIARLVGYRWPRQTGSTFVNCPAVEPDGLDEHAVGDGIVPLNAVKGEMPALDRLRALLSDVHGKNWSAIKQAELLSQVGFPGKTIEDWLCDGFFEQHCELFHQRPFIWHIWDGLRDGFQAFVNYHKIARSNGEGRRTLEKLIYTYLGDWIDRQRADQRNGVEGADGRVAAAIHLQSELKKILGGEPPYDIFVRWKPLYEQPIGWEPDINDGVRINIRPFMTAKILNGRGKSTCILRTTPTIRWEKDRGKDPHRPKEDFPWLWSWDEGTDNFSGGHEFDGTRWNDLHYSCKLKKEARENHKQRQQKKGAAK